MNTKYFVSYLLKIFGLSILLVSGGIILSKIFDKEIFLVNLISLIGFFLIINAVMHYLLIASSKAKPAKFVRVFMVVTFAKILVYLIFLVIYIVFLKIGLKAFLLCFVVTYLSFTIFEVLELSKILKNTNTK